MPPWSTELKLQKVVVCTTGLVAIGTNPAVTLATSFHLDIIYMLCGRGGLMASSSCKLEAEKDNFLSTRQVEANV